MDQLETIPLLIILVINSDGTNEEKLETITLLLVDKNIEEVKIKQLERMLM